MYVGIWKYFFLCIKTDVSFYFTFSEAVDLLPQIFWKMGYAVSAFRLKWIWSPKYSLPRHYYRIDKNPTTCKFFLCVKKNYPICTFAIWRFVTFSRHSYSLNILKIMTDRTVEKV